MDAVLGLLGQYWQEIVAFILGIGVVALYAEKFRALLREMAEVLIALDDILIDGKVTEDEVLRIKKEAIDVWEAIKKFKK